MKGTDQQILAHAECLKKASELFARADAWDGRIVETNNFTEKFVLQAVRTYKTSQQLLDAWDASVDGRISVPEFRMQIRSLGFNSTQVDVLEIDKLFQSFDTDCSAFLSLKEVEFKFKLMQKAIVKYNELVTRNRLASTRLREAANLQKHVTDLVVAYEKETKNLECRKEDNSS